MLCKCSILAHTAFNCQEPQVSLTHSTHDGVLFNKTALETTLTPPLLYQVNYADTWWTSKLTLSSSSKCFIKTVSFSLFAYKLFPLLPHLLKKLVFPLNILPLKSLLLWASRNLTARGLILQAQLGIVWQHKQSHCLCMIRSHPAK